MINSLWLYTSNQTKQLGTYREPSVLVLACYVHDDDDDDADADGLAVLTSWCLIYILRLIPPVACCLLTLSSNHWTKQMKKQIRKCRQSLGRIGDRSETLRYHLDMSHKPRSKI